MPDGSTRFTTPFFSTGQHSIHDPLPRIQAAQEVVLVDVSPRKTLSHGLSSLKATLRSTCLLSLR